MKEESGMVISFKNVSNYNTYFIFFVTEFTKYTLNIWFDKYLSNSHYVPGILLGIRDKIGNRITRSLARSIVSFVGGTLQFDMCEANALNKSLKVQEKL